MFVNLMQFGKFVLFGLLNVSVGQALFGERRSDVTLVIEFESFPRSFDKINIYFAQFRHSPMRNIFYTTKHVMTFTTNGVQCFSNFAYRYETRIVNVSTNFPTYVTFGLRNVSVYDSGCYFANDNTFQKKFGKRILHVGDTILRTCTLKQMEFEFVLPFSVFNETVAVALYNGIDLYGYVISICNPVAGTCVSPPRTTFPRFECKMNGSRITITLSSAQMENEGLYALIGSTSGVIFQSAVLHVIESVSTTAAFDVKFNITELPNLTTIYAPVNNNGTLYSRAIISSAAPITESVSTTAAFDVEFNTTELPNLTTIYAPVNNNVTSYSRAIISSAAPITDKLFENYFVGGGVVAGMTIVILICWLLWKRCYEIRGNGAGGDDYDTVDVHYYCSIRNQNEPVTQSETTTGSVPESQQLSAVMDVTTVYDNI